VQHLVAAGARRQKRVVAELACRPAERPVPRHGVERHEVAQLDDNLVEEVIDLILVVSLAEFGRLEPLVDYIFRR